MRWKMTLINVFFSAYCELLHLHENINDLTGIFKIFNNKITTEKFVGVLFVCFFDLLPFRNSLYLM